MSGIICQHFMLCINIVNILIPPYYTLQTLVWGEWEVIWHQAVTFLYDTMSTGLVKALLFNHRRPVHFNSFQISLGSIQLRWNYAYSFTHTPTSVCGEDSLIQLRELVTTDETAHLYSDSKRHLTLWCSTYSATAPVYHISYIIPAFLKYKTCIWWECLYCCMY